VLWATGAKAPGRRNTRETKANILWSWSWTTNLVM